jgi:hypothetical protein
MPKIIDTDLNMSAKKFLITCLLKTYNLKIFVGKSNNFLVEFLALT